MASLSCLPVIAAAGESTAWSLTVVALNSVRLRCTAAEPRIHAPNLMWKSLLPHSDAKLPALPGPPCEATRASRSQVSTWRKTIFAVRLLDRCVGSLQPWDYPSDKGWSLADMSWYSAMACMAETSLLGGQFGIGAADGPSRLIKPAESLCSAKAEPFTTLPGNFRLNTAKRFCRMELKFPLL